MSDLPPQDPPAGGAQQGHLRLGVEPPSQLELNPEPVYWMGIASIKSAKTPEALLASARLGDGHALATALWICCTHTTAILYQQVAVLAQKVAELENKLQEKQDESIQRPGLLS